MKQFLKVLLVVFITIIVIILSAFAYVIIKNPLGIGDLVQASLIQKEVEVDMSNYADYDHPLLTEEQEERIIKSGVDIKKIPTEITPAQQKCGIDKLGEDRISEIINGADPSPLEIIKVLPCLQ